MKKILSTALVALTALIMASCEKGDQVTYKQGDQVTYKQGDQVTYKQGDAMPTIDNSKQTVNGHYYDNDTEKCWKVEAAYTIKTSGSNTSRTETRYVWGTEFYLVSLIEMEMWGMAQTGEYTSCSYSYSVTTDQDSDSCEEHNDF